MKFMILIHSNPLSREIWSDFTREQQEAGIQYYAELTADLERSGELVVSHALADPAQGRRLPAEGQSADGPFAEVKEHLAGFILVDCVDLDRAVRIAGRVPEASLGLVEVRPAVDAADLVR
ncbi:YciI family protein [Dactylosporangium sp. NBC_01737]|uniref:YciI family protein n=1 Tax=Dactylosporangium sp. NBC_01737 TaxID=2975959 RepID=UPI002E1626A1|nr:YciI family protein [Dactylosporangium sp. NBC_01737]